MKQTESFDRRIDRAKITEVFVISTQVETRRRHDGDLWPRSEMQTRRSPAGEFTHEFATRRVAVDNHYMFVAIELHLDYLLDS
jgi:hypothetical protein